MADLRKLLNGIVQTKEELFSGATKLPGTLYFVRTDTKGKEGYIYLNGRKYGDVSEIRTELEQITGTLPTGTTIAELFEEVNNAIATLDERTENIEQHVDSAETRLDTLEAAQDATEVDVENLEAKTDETNERVDKVEEAIDILNGDETESGSVEYKIAEAISKLPSDFVVEGGHVEVRSGETYLILNIKGGDEVAIPAKDLVDTYTSDDEYIEVNGYKISLNVDKLSEVLATKEEANSLQNQVDALASILRITGDNVQTISNAQINANMIKDVTENGGTAVLTDNVVVDKTISIE